MKRVVFDTNTMISGLFWKGIPRKALDIVRHRKWILLSTKEIEKELIRVLGYPKFSLTAEEILPIMEDYEGYTERIFTVSKLEVIKEDPTDNLFLECAVDGEAKYIVSGNHHLLDLGKYQKIRIIKASEFVELAK